MSKNQRHITIIHHFRIKELKKSIFSDFTIFKGSFLTS